MPGYCCNIDYESLFEHKNFSDCAVGAQEDDAILKEIVAGAFTQGFEFIVNVTANGNSSIQTSGDARVRVAHLSLREPNGTNDVGPIIPGFPNCEIKEVRKEVFRRVGSRNYIVTCLNILEHIDREDLPDLLVNLAKLIENEAFISIRTSPSIHYNYFNPSVFPLSLWVKLFNAVGLDAEQLKIYQNKIISGLEVDDPNWNVNHWYRQNPFRELDSGGVYLLRIKPTGDDGDEFNYVEAKRKIDRLTRIAPWATRRLGQEEFGEKRIFLFTPTAMSFWHIVGLLELIPRQNLVICLPDQDFRFWSDQEFETILSYLSCRGVHTRSISAKPYEQLKDFERGRDLFVSSVGNNLNLPHLVSASISAFCRLRHVPSVYLQHGIWASHEFWVPKTWGQDYLFTWHSNFSRDYTPIHTFDDWNSTLQKGYLDDKRLVVTGAPRFDIYADPEPLSAPDLFGSWAAKFGKVNLFATNLHAHFHGIDQDDMRRRLLDIISKHPDQLFIFRPHPDENSTELVRIIDDQGVDNALVFDAHSSAATGIWAQDLIRASNRVVTSVSTIALEAALAKKDCLIFDTKANSSYSGTKTISLEELRKEIGDSRGKLCIPNPASFSGKYYETNLLGKASESLVRALIAVIDKPISATKPSGDILLSSLLPEVLLLRKKSVELDQLKSIPFVYCARQLHQALLKITLLRKMVKLIKAGTLSLLSKFQNARLSRH